jgi:hypothetical protein
MTRFAMIYLLGVVGARSVSLDQPRAARLVITTLPTLARIGFSRATSSTHNKWSAAVLTDEPGLSLDERIGQALQSFADRTVVRQHECRNIDRLSVPLSKV